MTFSSEYEWLKRRLFLAAGWKRLAKEHQHGESKTHWILMAQDRLRQLKTALAERDQARTELSKARARILTLEDDLGNCVEYLTAPKLAK